MQINFTRRADYSVKAMVYLARRRPDRRTRARAISEEMEVPYKFLTQILADLVAGGLLEAKAGPAGGYVLARPAETIDLLEILETADGAVAEDQCAISGGPCHWTEVCPIHDTWTAALAALKTRLRATSLADLAEIDAAIEAGSYEPTSPPHQSGR